MIAACVVLVRLLLGGFVVEATAEKSYTLEIPREGLRGYGDDIGLFRRHMPGVKSVEARDDGRYLYRTEKHLPLGGVMCTDFLIARSVEGDSTTRYESVDTTADNFMSCEVTIAPMSDHSTRISLRLRIRLRRESAGDIHWLAPIVGEHFISARMKEDLDAMLDDFVKGSSEELYHSCRQETSSR